MFVLLDAPELGAGRLWSPLSTSGDSLG